MKRKSGSRSHRGDTLRADDMRDVCLGCPPGRRSSPRKPMAAYGAAVLTSAKARGAAESRAFHFEIILISASKTCYKASSRPPIRPGFFFYAQGSSLMTVDAIAPTAFNWRRFLADTDAGSVITAAQSGAQWGYSLLLLQIVLIPILYIVQELTVRLGAVTGKGHAALIKQHFGLGWAWLSVATLIVTCLGALLTEFAGLAGVGNLLGVPAPVTLALVVVAMLAMALWHGYATVERIAIGVGAFELVFLLVAMLAHPGLAEMASGAATIPLADPKYLLLASANIGAVIMPWMVFFQQS